MNVLVGVDPSGSYRAALDSVLALGLGPAEVHLLNVVSSVMVDGSYPDSSMTGALAQIYDELKADGQGDLAEAKGVVEAAGLTGVTAQGFGDVAGQLLDYADSHGCELVAVASESKDYFGSLFYGSVAKGLVTGAAQNVLVIKGGKALSAPVTAVVATDHSEYANKCFDLLVEMAPEGIGAYHVVSAFGPAKTLAAKYREIVEGATANERALVKAHLETKTKELADRLASATGASVSSAVVEGRPGPVIADAMAEHSAGLLIMGAQGHGFLERLALGSVSFHQVVGTENNVLILRA